MCRRPCFTNFLGTADVLDLDFDSTSKVIHIPVEIGFVQVLAPFLPADEKIDAARSHRILRIQRSTPPCCRYELMSFSDRTHT